MYKAFYNLTKNPFEITPDPGFLFPTKSHNEALTALYYGVRRRKGFVVLTGEVGTGKTLLVRCLLELLKARKVAYAYVFNSCLSPLEFLQYVAADFGLSASGRNKSDLLQALGNYLVERHQKGLTTVLVVDEAHHLSPEVLEEIRLLTNLETSQAKLLQILLVGQSELDEKLDSSELRQLKQRIALRSQLGPLSLEETSGYVRSRLQLAGANSHAAELFPPETVARVHRHSRGIPRLINTVCENALITAYANQVRCITPDVIDSVAADFRLNVTAPPRRRLATTESDDVQQAARILLEIYKRVKGADSRSQRETIAVAQGKVEQESII